MMNVVNKWFTLALLLWCTWVLLFPIALYLESTSRNLNVLDYILLGVLNILSFPILIIEQHIEAISIDFLQLLILAALNSIVLSGILLLIYSSFKKLYIK